MRAAQDLQQQVADPTSVLRAGQITRHARSLEFESSAVKDGHQGSETPQALIRMLARIEAVLSAEQAAKMKAEADADSFREDHAKACAEVLM